MFEIDRGPTGRIHCVEVLGDVTELAAVKERLRRDWVEIENASKGESLKPIRVFRAFATAQAADGGEAEVGPLLAALHPARASDFDYLATAWPELRSFLMANLPA